MLRMGQWPCCYLFCLYKRPIRQLWITMTKTLVNYRTYKTTNGLRSIDAHAENGAVTVLLSLLPIQAANWSVMHNNDQDTVELPYLQDHKSLTLRWRSCYEWCSNHVVSSFANNSGQYVRYAYQWPSHWRITVISRPPIVDAPLTLMPTKGRWPCCYLFCQ